MFHTDAGDLELTEGDRLDLPEGSLHAASVGPDGCECVEAYRAGPVERSLDGTRERSLDKHDQERPVR